MRSSQPEITSPCHESWDAMRGGAERRFCDICQKDVHNLSAMGHEEAAALLREKAGEHLCVRYTAESDGALRFRDLVPRASLTRRIVKAAFAAPMPAACAPHGDGPPIDGLGDAVIDSMRQDTVPTADGGCDYATGPFTTVHLPPGHTLCVRGDDDPSGRIVTPPPEAPPPPRPVVGAPPPTQRPADPPPPAVDPRPVQKMGEMVADPTPKKDAFVPCDPKPGFAPPPPPIDRSDVKGELVVPEPPAPPPAEVMGGLRSYD